MAWYFYQHASDSPTPCQLGAVFEIERAMTEPPLAACPACGQPVQRLYTPPNVHSPTGDSTLRNVGFSKLVRRDQGVYENVTAQDSEKRIISFNPGKEQ
jgi:hypothetical protein